MMQQYMTQLAAEFSLGTLVPVKKDENMHVTIGPFSIEMIELNPGVHFSALVAPLPPHDTELFLLEAMKANFLGQGTGGAVLGLKEDESFLTLSLSLPYEVNYRTFKEAVEEFVNYLEYWKNEIARYATKDRID